MKVSCSQNSQQQGVIKGTVISRSALEFSEHLFINPALYSATHFHSFGARLQKRGRQPMEQRWIMLKIDNSCNCSMKAKHLTLPPALEQEPMLAWIYLQLYQMHLKVWTRASCCRKIQCQNMLIILFMLLLHGRNLHGQRK